MTIDINIPGYVLKQQVGKGGMATVYLAVQESFGRDVALKVMSPLLNADPSFSARFLREARIVSQMHHGHIVPVYDVGEHKRNEFLSMEFLAGGDLRSRVNQSPTLEFALEVCIPMAFALDYAHSKGVLHRDVKPENILFREDGTPVLTDFGIARAADTGTSVTQNGMLVGTPAYVSPEQARGLVLDGRTDLYSLGIVFYELLTGIQPFRADSAITVVLKHLNDAIPALPPRFAHVQPFLDRALAKDPAGRFATGAEMAQALQEFLPSYASVRTAAPGSGLKAVSPRPTASAAMNGPVVVASPPSFTAASTSGFGASTLSLLRSPPVRYGALTAVAVSLAVAGAMLLSGSGQPESFAVTSSAAVGASDAGMEQKMQLLTEAGVARLSKDMLQAESLYRRVLVMDSKNKIALTGMAAIAEYYRGVASDALAAKDAVAAEEALQHAMAIEPTDERAENLQARLLLLRQQQPEPSQEPQARTEERLERPQSAPPVKPAASLAPRPPLTAGPAAVAAPSSTPPTSSPADERATRLAQLLEQGQGAERRGERVSPPGESALDYYLQARDLDAGNEIARRSLAEIALELASRLEQALQKEDAAEADERLSQLRRIDPARPGLNRYAARLAELKRGQTAVLMRQERREQKLEQKALEFLAKGDRYLQGGLTLRNVYSAGRLHATAAELAPSMGEVAVFRDRVQVAFENLLTQELSTGDPRRARDVLDYANKVGFVSASMAQLEASLAR